jgi:hypothetical protein
MFFVVAWAVSLSTASADVGLLESVVEGGNATALFVRPGDVSKINVFSRKRL